MGVIFTFVMGLLMCFEPITDTDWFWHYVVGAVINKNHIIPNKEMFSWVGDYSWTAHEWFTENIMYKLGPWGCLIIMLIIFLALYIIMAKMLRVKLKKIFDFKLCYLLLMTIFFKVTGPRPYVLSLLMMAYLVYVLFSYVDEKKHFDKLIWTIPILQIVWVNFHGGSSSLAYIFIIGILLCHLFLKIFKFNEERWTSNILNKKQVKTLCIVLVLTLIASCINPFGYKMLLYPFENMADSSMIEYIIEWQSASYHGLLGIYIFIMMAFPLFNLILQKKKMKLHEIAFQLLLFYMAMKSQRFIGMFGIYSTWMIGKYFFVSDEMYETLRKPFKRFEKIITVCFCTLLVAIVGFVGYKQIGYIAKQGPIDNHGYYSDTAIKELIKLKPQRMFNEYSQGGYLLYKLNEYNALDDVHIFAYGLGDVFSKQVLPDARHLEYLDKDTRAIIEKYDFDVILTTTEHPTHFFIEEMEEYKLYYKDDMCYIFVKENSNQAV